MEDLEFYIHYYIYSTLYTHKTLQLVSYSALCVEYSNGYKIPYQKLFAAFS